MWTHHDTQICSQHQMQAAADHEVTFRSHWQTNKQTFGLHCKPVLVDLILSFLLTAHKHMTTLTLRMAWILRSNVLLAQGVKSKEWFYFSKQEIFEFHLTNIRLQFLLCSFMMTICQDIFNICITCLVYEVRRKGIIYSKTYFLSLFTSCLGIKVRVTKLVLFCFLFLFFFGQSVQ